MALTKATYSMIDGAPVNVLDFGATGDGVTDDWQAIKNAIDSGAGKIYFPAGIYYCTKALLIYKTCTLEGETGFESGPSPSVLKFADTTCGIVVHRSNTTCDEYGYNQTTGSSPTGGDGTVIRHLTIQRGNGADTTIDGVTHGVRFRARAHIDSCYISGFAGDGVHILATSGGGGAVEGNANNWGISNTRIQNCRDGVFVDGADVNVGLGLHVDASSNQRYGVYDSSFLGCNWVGCHFNGNADHEIFHDNINARSLFAGCYVESGGSVSIAEKALICGGSYAGVTVTGGQRWIDGVIDLTGTANVGSLSAVGGTTGTGRYVSTWNQGSVSATRLSTYNFRSGTEASNMPTGSVYGAPTASNITNRSAVGFEIYDGSTSTYSRAVEANGALNAFIPYVDNTWNLGSVSFRWGTVYAVTGTINTSDAREKTFLDIEEAETAAALEIKANLRKFKFNAAIAEKNESARIHFGASAQQVGEIMKSHSLDPAKYAFFCHDVWDAETDDDGKVIREAGDRYGLRYEELLAFIIAAL